MSLKEEVDILRNVPLFAHIAPSKLKLLAFTSERLVFHADQVLFHQGEPGDAAYIVLQGEADVIVNSPTGPLTVARLGHNDIVGEIAILCDVPRTATIKASESLLTLRIKKDMFYKLVSEFPAVAIEMMRELAHRVEDTNQKLRDATANKAA